MLVSKQEEHLGKQIGYSIKWPFDHANGIVVLTTIKFCPVYNSNHKRELWFQMMPTHEQDSERGRASWLSICQCARQSPDAVGGAITQGGRNCRMVCDDENEIRSGTYRFLISLGARTMILDRQWVPVVQ
ncbi:hypothetical protein CEXT_348571 [Caerostris extrusa]|uniref:Uncharacterized protein n=1 Tax=Caerostris extrusa TaxID=172846 RepID=A0AAV4YCE2_CAEEX|nr:hypothetical protein CEXT_348571 [Caerostris extrusa]